MKVFLLGATGNVGSAITDELLAHDYPVIALARSDESERTLAEKGVSVVRGDLRKPDAWQAIVHDVDAIIHAAATFDEDMGEVDRRMVQALIEEGGKAARSIKFIYTGGCWLYGETGDTIATEHTSFSPLPSFAWMTENGEMVMRADCFDGLIVHPAMVYNRDGGVISRYIDSAEKTGQVEIWGSLDTRWPVVHQKDLAVAYRLALENGRAGEHYNIAAEKGVMVSHMAEVIGQRYSLTSPPLVRDITEVIAEQGAWAAGPALDQQMSGEKALSELGWHPTTGAMLLEIG